MAPDRGFILRIAHEADARYKPVQDVRRRVSIRTGELSGELVSPLDGESVRLPLNVIRTVRRPLDSRICWDPAFLEVLFSLNKDGRFLSDRQSGRVLHTDRLGIVHLAPGDPQN